MACGALSLIAGPEGLGKSTLAYWMAAEITRGRLPGVHHGTPKAVLVVATEDSWEHTIVPRLMAARADLDRIYRVEVTTTVGTFGTLTLPRDNSDLHDAIVQTGAAMVLLDPLMSRVSGDLDTHRDQETRQALEPLVDIADRTGCGVVGLIHFNKSNSGAVLDNVMASKAFTAVARSVSMIVRDADDPTRRLFGTPKNNLGPDDLPLLSFTLTGHTIDTAEGLAHTSRIIWGPEVAGELGEHIAGNGQDSEARSMAAEARQWLSEYMDTQGGETLAADAQRAYGEACGERSPAANRRLNTAKRKLGYVNESRGYPARYYWLIPQSACVDTSLGESSTLSTLSTQGVSASSVDSVDSVDVPPRVVTTQGSQAMT